MISASDILNAKILIVDDLEANISLLERMLHGGGYRSISSTMDPGMVCELHLLNRYDLILLDLQMPGMDGFQVMENLKEIEAGSYLPVLVITAQPEHKLRALKVGAKDFLSKPLDLAEVLLRVHNMLEVRLLHQESRKLYERIAAEQKISERLLLNLLPESIADYLKENPHAIDAKGTAGLISSGFAEITVFFSNVLAFTRFAEGASGAVLGGVLTDISTHFDCESQKHNTERFETIDNAHLAAIGLTDEVANRSIRASHQALDILAALDRFNSHSRFKLKLRIGFDTRETSGGRTIKRTFYRDF
ncbi:MAG: response regulator [Holophaga sp.]|nr:response regulator [Holophaga sp.]